jgi:hypothetical protein
MTKLAQAIDFNQLQQSVGSTKSPSVSIGFWIGETLPIIYALAGIGLLIYLTTGGFKIMTAAGDPKKIQEGQHTITNALIGFVVVFFSYWIVSIVALMLGIDSIISIF